MGGLAVGSLALAGCTGGGGGESYPSDDITWIHPTSGGVAGAYAQAFREFMPNYLPNDVDIVVEEEGNPSVGYNTLQMAEPDGHTAGWLLMPGLFEIARFTESQIDIDEFELIGYATRLTWALFVATDGEHQSLEDLQAADEVVAAAAGGAGLPTLTIPAAKVLDINMRFVTGYEGPSDYLAATLRGESDVLALPVYHPATVSGVQDGDLEMVYSYGEEPPEHAPDVATAGDMGHDETLNLGLQHYATLPPETPDDIHSTLESAFLDTLRSDEFENWAKESGPLFTFLEAGDSDDAIDGLDRFSSLVDQYSEELRAVMS